MSGNIYTLVGCSRCSNLWIVPDFDQMETTDCTRCGTTHTTDQLRRLEHDTEFDVVAEQRARRLAERAGRLKTYTHEKDDYGEQADTVAKRTRIADHPDADIHAHLVDQSLEEYRERFDDQVAAEHHLEAVYADDAEAYLERRFDYSSLESAAESGVADDYPQGKRPREAIEDAGAPDFAIRSTAPVDANARLVLNDDAPTSLTKLHAQLLHADALGEHVLAAVRDLVAGATPAEARQTLHEAGVTALKGHYTDIALAAADGRKTSVTTFLALTERLGRGKPDGFDTTAEDCYAPLNALARWDDQPTLAVKLEQSWFDACSRIRRRRLLEYLRALARGVEVIILPATGAVDLKLYQQHRQQLPASVTERAESRLLSEDEATLLDRARTEIAIDTVHERILTTVRDAADQTRRYQELYEHLAYAESTIRRSITEVLASLKLVHKVRHDGEPAITLSHVGEQFLDRLESKIGRQQPLVNSSHDSVTSSSQSSGEAVCAHASPSSPAEEAASQAVPLGDDTSNWQPIARNLSQAEHAEAIAPTYSGGIGLVERDVRMSDGEKQPVWSWDRSRSELIVGAIAENPMQYAVCLALALTDPKTFHEDSAILTPEILEGTAMRTYDPGSDDDGPFAGLDLSSSVLLRQFRCLGFLKEEYDSAEAFIEEGLKVAREKLLAFVTQYGRNEDDAPTRSTITRFAQGLAGTMLHLLDLADVDVTRVMYLPEMGRNIDEDLRRDLAASVVFMAAVQSELEQRCIFRQVYEHREDKIKQAFGLDTSDVIPVGRLLGSFTIVGDDTYAFQAHLEAEFETPSLLEAREDAPAVVVDVPIRRGDRKAAYARALRWLCGQRHLSVTPKAVEQCYAFAGSLHAIGEAFSGTLTDERRRPRAIRTDEVRKALVSLGPAQMDAAYASEATMLRVLLKVDAPVGKVDLADRADVHERTVARHWGRLIGRVGAVIEGAAIRIDLQAVAPGEPEADMQNREVLRERVREFVADDREAATIVVTLGRAVSRPQSLSSVIPVD